MFDWLKKFIVNESQPKKMKPVHYFIVLLGVGLALMIFTDFLSAGPDRPPDSTSITPNASNQDSATLPVLGNSGNNDVIRQYENMYETQLAEILEKVIGVGKVEVMVNLDSTPEIVIAKDDDSKTSSTQETDKEKATRTQSDQSKNEKVVIVQGNKQEQPVVVKTLKPKVRGVLVVAKGADNIQVKAWITEAVQKVMEVPAYKISILPKKG